MLWLSVNHSGPGQISAQFWVLYNDHSLGDAITAKGMNTIEFSCHLKYYSSKIYKGKFLNDTVPYYTITQMG